MTIFKLKLKFKIINFNIKVKFKMTYFKINLEMTHFNLKLKFKITNFIIKLKFKMTNFKIKQNCPISNWNLNLRWPISKGARGKEAGHPGCPEDWLREAQAAPPAAAQEALQHSQRPGRVNPLVPKRALLHLY